jgi:hypothetical protein
MLGRRGEPALSLLSFAVDEHTQRKTAANIRTAFVINFIGSAPPTLATAMMTIFDVANRYFIYDFFGFVQAKSVNVELIVEWNEWNSVLLLTNNHESGEGNRDP